MLRACTVRFDVTENLKNFLIFEWTKHASSTDCAPANPPPTRPHCPYGCLVPSPPSFVPRWLPSSSCHHAEIKFIISSAVGFIFVFSRGCQDLINISILWINTTGDAITFSLKTRLFLDFQRDHKAPADRKMISICFLPRLFSTISKNSDKQLVATTSQPRHSRKNVQRKIAKGHWKRIWSEVSNWSDTKYFSGPDHFFFFSRTPHWILSCIAIQKKILTFKGTGLFQISIALVSFTPPNIKSKF